MGKCCEANLATSYCGLDPGSPETQDQDQMNSQSNPIMTQRNLDQDQVDPQSSNIVVYPSVMTSISFGPSGLATHCFGMSLSFSPRSKHKIPQDQDYLPNRGLDMDMEVIILL